MNISEKWGRKVIGATWCKGIFWGIAFSPFPTGTAWYIHDPTMNTDHPTEPSPQFLAIQFPSLKIFHWTFTFSLNRNSFFFVTSEFPASFLSCYGAVIRRNKCYLNTSTVLSETATRWLTSGDAARGALHVPGRGQHTFIMLLSLQCVNCLFLEVSVEYFWNSMVWK